MWVRSQNRKSLLNVNEIRIEEDKKIDDKVLISANSCSMPTIGGFYLGFYPIERAIEILDDIEKILNDKQIANPLQYEGVYQLPKDKKQIKNCFLLKNE